MQQRTKALEMLTFPAGMVLPQCDAAQVEFSLMPAINVEAEPFFGGYMEDDMLGGMGVKKAEETVEEALYDEA